MTDADVHPETGRKETPEERADRNLGELLQELRVALPGVQVLFAFLLVVPFNQGFTRVTSFEKNVYFATLLATTLAAVLLIAPSAHHRLEFRRQHKEEIVVVGNRLAVAGLAFLALAMVGVVMLVTDFLFGVATTAVATASAALAFAWVWFGVPLRRRSA